jgi:chemotaxis protein CheD
MNAANRQLIVGIADCKVTSDRDSTIATYNLGSCVAVAVHDPVAQVGGILHLMLPASSLDPGKAEANPWIFADTGIPRLLARVCRAGAAKSRLIVRLAGGAQLADAVGTFNIGGKNCIAVRQVLRHAGLEIHSESTGGRDSRTVLLDVESGRCLMRTSAGAEEYL